MVLEACMVCIDSSAFARNGDMPPSRVMAQIDAATLICNTKLNSNRESAVGLLTLGGDRVTVRVSPTGDSGCLLSALHGIECNGEADFLRGIQIAQLALKHRMNKSQKQRIMLFVASPLNVQEKTLTHLGKQLKKNNVSVDVICLSDFTTNMPKLTAFHNAVNSDSTSHIVEYPAGSGKLLSDVLVTAMILQDRAVPHLVDGQLADTNTAAAVNEFGVDPTADPELYLALRLSLEEERARQQRAAPAETAAPAATTANGLENMEMGEDVDEELRQALMLSLVDYAGNPNENAEASQSNESPTEDTSDSNGPADMQTDQA